MPTTMDRGKVIELLYKFWGNGLTDDESSNLIMNYLNERGIDAARIGKFTIHLYEQERGAIPHCLSHIFEEYRREHSINYIYKNPSPLDANKRVVVLIY